MCLQAKGSYIERLQEICSHDASSQERFQREFPIEKLVAEKDHIDKQALRRLGNFFNVYIVLNINSLRSGLVQLDDKKEVCIQVSIFRVLTPVLLATMHVQQQWMLVHAGLWQSQ